MANEAKSKELDTSIKNVKIQSVAQIVPKTGSNAGIEMTVINGQYWHNKPPQANDVFVCLQDAEVNGVTYTNVVGYDSGSRLTLEQKMKHITENDAAYSQALAHLLK